LESLQLAARLLQNCSTSLLAKERSLPEMSNFVALDLYTIKMSVSLEDMYNRASTVSVPRAVKRIFDLAVDRTLSTAESMVVLTMADRLIELEAGTLGHLDGTLWLSTLVARMETVHHVFD
jgi:hypothetical protein